MKTALENLPQASYQNKECEKVTRRAVQDTRHYQTNIKANLPKPQKTPFIRIPLTTIQHQIIHCQS